MSSYKSTENSVIFNEKEEEENDVTHVSDLYYYSVNQRKLRC